MALAQPAIDTLRNREWKQTRTYLSHVNMGSLTVTQITISGVQVRIRKEASDGLADLHRTSIERAVRTVSGAGHQLPALDFYLCSSQNVPNVAMKTYIGNNPAPVIFLGPKMWSKNPMQAGTGTMVTGGVGTSGPRGIADQVYDGTTRFFGNPKQKAQGETIVIHELGHILHEINNPGVFWEEQQAAEQQQPSPNAPGWQNLATDVSHYAGNNALEFVAEVFAGTLVGKAYSQQVMAAYAALGGP
jgi:hypothetical protein